MVKASSAAANGLANSPSIITESTDSATPTASASSARILPDGTGRPRVRVIRASMSASHHMFSAPDAPAPIAMHRIEAKAMTGCTGAGAAASPTTAVKITSDITRGLSSAT